MLSKEEINEKLEWLRKSFPRRPTPSPFIKINQERKMETTTPKPTPKPKLPSEKELKKSMLAENKRREFIDKNKHKVLHG